MRYLGGCTQCHTIWRGCRCPLRCEECGAGYRDDGHSTCGTPGCATGERRYWMIQGRWDEDRRAEASAPIRCEEVSEPTPAVPEAQAERVSDETPPAPVPAARRRPSVQNNQVRKPDARSAARPSSRTDEPAHRPVADRRAAVEALLTEGLSDREIARRVKVSPSTVSAVRRDRENAVSAIQGNP